MTPKNGYLSSEFHALIAFLIGSFGIGVKLLQDLSTQNSFLALHPTVAAIVGAGLAFANAITLATYIKGRSVIKAADIVVPTAG